MGDHPSHGPVRQKGGRSNGRCCRNGSGRSGARGSRDGSHGEYVGVPPSDPASDGVSVGSNIVDPDVSVYLAVTSPTPQACFVDAAAGNLEVHVHAGEPVLSRRSGNYVTVAIAKAYAKLNTSCYAMSSLPRTHDLEIGELVVSWKATRDAVEKSRVVAGYTDVIHRTRGWDKCFQRYQLRVMRPGSLATVVLGSHMKTLRNGLFVWRRKWRRPGPIVSTIS